MEYKKAHNFLYEKSLEKNFSNKNFHDICLSINTLNEFKKYFHYV